MASFMYKPVSQGNLNMTWGQLIGLLASGSGTGGQFLNQAMQKQFQAPGI